ncbi:MAG TPA: glycosyltransferase [Candidatus Limnocylindria bacterium]|jgi:glycosyltransferase involved in cell wall biosynthesis|nr:glycosyltransferase [Candidatus Limnocylindria bacterium]
MTSAKVRVLHVLPSIRGYGAEHQVVELLKRLPSERIEPVLLTIYEPAPEEREGLPFPVFHVGRKTRKDMLFLGRAVGEIRRIAPAIVHTHTHVGKYWGRLAARIAGVPLIVHTEHNPCDFRRTALERVADRVLDPCTARVVTFFREQGASLSSFEHLPPAKMVIIPNGLADVPEGCADRDATRARLGFRPGEHALFVVGRMEFQKNQSLALRTLAALREDVLTKTLLVFVGSGRDETLLRALARAIDVEHRVRFLGYRTDVSAILGAADLVLMTSWFEGMPLTLLEAMLASVPIVSTPWVGARNMLGEGRYGFLAPDFEPAHVASVVERALAHPLACRRLAERARRHADEEYGIGRMVEAHRRLYVRLQEARA